MKISFLIFRIMNDVLFKIRLCPLCNGISKIKPSYNGIKIDLWMQCPECNGYGIIGKNKTLKFIKDGNNN